MPGTKDRNLRSGDLHEELGLFLLRGVALVAPVPRTEDVGSDAFATLVRPEGGRKLIPDVSLLVQLKAASVRLISYTKVDELNWLTGLEIPIFVGSVDLQTASITLYSTYLLHQILLERGYDEIHLSLGSDDDGPVNGNGRMLSIAPAVHKWSVPDLSNPGFVGHTFSVLKPHVEILRRNRQLRNLGYQETMTWETGKPPSMGGTLMHYSTLRENLEILQSMVPSIQRLVSEITSKNRFGDLDTVIRFVELMRRWGCDPDPNGLHLQMALAHASGPEISIQEIIRMRAAAFPPQLDLSGLDVPDDALIAIPDGIRRLNLANTQLTDNGIVHLRHLIGLSHLNLTGTKVTDSAVVELEGHSTLEWLKIGGTGITETGRDRLKGKIPAVQIVE
ncbi:MAG TPA: hypothetical protein VE988_14765 [Gemmataceae bacterium]|nr:hypothetical protein [Gemmataceae bacterium]